MTLIIGDINIILLTTELLKILFIIRNMVLCRRLHPYLPGGQTGLAPKALGAGPYRAWAASGYQLCRLCPEGPAGLPSDRP
jgi:hypothetical protein